MVRSKTSLISWIRTHFIFSLFFLLTLLFSSYIRLNNISTNPPALFSDEADLSYQANFFNHCFSDYFGNKFPFHFHSFSDWRTSLPIYSTSLSQLLFGVNEFSTRLPPAIYGILSLLAFYWLTYLLFHKPWVSLLAMFTMGVNPWQFHYSRSAFEATGMLFIYILSLCFLILFHRSSKPRHLLLFLFFQSLTVYFYSTANLFFIITLLLAFIFSYRQIFSLKPKHLIFISFALLIFMTPYILDIVQGKSGYRFSYISVFSDPTVSKQVDVARENDDIVKNGKIINQKVDFQDQFFHNKPSHWISDIIANYISSFSTNFLLLHGDDNLRHGFTGFGYFYIIDFFLIILSFVFASKNKYFFFFLILLALSPLPFSLTRDSVSPHGTRLFLMMFFILTLEAFAIYYIYQFLSSHKSKSIFAGSLFFIFYISSFIYFYHFYNYHYPQISARYWHVGMKESVLEAVKFSSSYDRIYFDNKFEPFRPFFLNWSQSIPSSCNLNTALTWSSLDGFTGQSYDNKYYIGYFEWSQFFNNPISTQNSSLIVIPSSDMKRFNQELTLHNAQTNSKPISFSIIKTITPPYQETENFILISLKNEK